LNVAAGLGELMCSKYKAAARLFLSANIDHCDFPEVPWLPHLKYIICLMTANVVVVIVIVVVIAVRWHIITQTTVSCQQTVRHRNPDNVWIAGYLVVACR